MIFEYLYVKLKKSETLEAVVYVAPQLQFQK